MSDQTKFSRKQIEIKTIKIPERFREKFENMDLLKESIEKYGVFNPVIIDGENTLISGHRRILACLELGMEFIPHTRLDVDTLRLREIEFEENEQREDFTWEERAKAVKELHELKVAQEGRASAGRGKFGASMTQLAEELGKSKATISTDIGLADALEDNPEIMSKAKNRTEAIKLMVRTREIELKNELLKRAMETETLDESSCKLYNVDCIKWMKEADPKQFDVILTDPPYGIDIAESMKTQVDFEDGQKEFEEFIPEMLEGCDRVAKDNAHIYVFHSPDGWNVVKGTLIRLGWSVDPKPIIWVRNLRYSKHLGYVPLGGRVRNADRRFPMSYEMITFATKGLKALQYQGEPNVIFQAGLTKDKMHPTEKPVPLLRKLLEYSLLPGDKVFDPCAGSGSVLSAVNLFKDIKVTGVACEIDENYFAAAHHRLSMMTASVDEYKEGLDKKFKTYNDEENENE